tara:strand:- start:211 stop:627 length:417 start_codon:yes stop_codon:yes gene_type:complete
MRFEVPQFIDVDDKIFGPLTWRQFVYLGGGVGIAVVLFFFNFFAFLFIGLPLALFAAALSFYPVNNRPFSNFVEAIFNYLSNQRLYLWQKSSDVVYRGSESAQEAPAPQTIISTAKPKKNISSLARKLELQALQKSEN